VICYYLIEGGGVHREWLLSRDRRRLRFLEQNRVEEISLDLSVSTAFPKIEIISSARIVANSCRHSYIDLDEYSKHMICEICHESIE